MSESNQFATLRDCHSGTPVMEGAGVKVRRLIGSSQLGHQDPFLMLDEFRSDQPDDYLAGFPEHPHRGFETLTYLLAGAMAHRDHLGNQGLLEPGGAQWMRAGRGVLHSEMPQQRDGLLWGFQLWLNLPARDKMSPPAYRDLGATEVPAVVDDQGVERRVIAGDSLGVAGAVSELVTQPLIVDLRLPPTATLTHPLEPGATVLLYLYRGRVRIDNRWVAAGELARLEGGNAVALTADAEGAGALLLAALRLGEPVVQYGPFVMNSDAEIAEAIADYRGGRLI